MSKANIINRGFLACYRSIVENNIFKLSKLNMKHTQNILDGIIVLLYASILTRTLENCLVSFPCCVQLKWLEYSV